MLVCFAVKEEAAPFARQVEAPPRIRVLVTGMGARNAERALRAALTEPPSLVLTCGFAGGLNPAWVANQVLFSLDAPSSLDQVLREAGARPGRFHCTDRVATTAAEKAALWKESGADAIEMESQVMRDLCRLRGVPSATIRVILDTAREDLPLDFNQLLTPEHRIHAGKLAVALARSPGRIGALLAFRQRTQAAAERLAEVLLTVTRTPLGK